MIEIRQLSKWYGAFQVLADCSTTVRKGEVVVVCGPSGSGKSTLIKCVNALEPFQQGSITVDGVAVGDPKVDMNKLRSRVGMVFQHFELFPHLSIVEENLSIAQRKVLKRSAEEARTTSMALLQRVGMRAHAHKYPSQLSGGRHARDGLCAQGGPPRDLHGPGPHRGGLRQGGVLRQPDGALGPSAAVPLEDPPALTALGRLNARPSDGRPRPRPPARRPAAVRA